MELAALLEMTHQLHQDHFCFVHEVVSGDDSAMKSQMKWSNKDYMHHYKLK
jgi:hypothetical protein